MGAKEYVFNSSAIERTQRIINIIHDFDSDMHELYFKFLYQFYLIISSVL